MKKLAVFGNCQAGQLKRMLSKLLKPSEFEVIYISNNTRTGGMKSINNILSIIENCDILLYQPLNSSHGELSEENIKKITRDSCISISFPYIFNAGVYSLCHAPMANGHSYGMIYGEQEIIKELEKGRDRNSIIKDYQEGKIDFNLKERFNLSIDKMEIRESSIDIKLIPFIRENYKRNKLFITHNHPTNILFIEMIKQIINIAFLPIAFDFFNRVSDDQLPDTNSPVSTFDINTHGYAFEHNDDWIEKGTFLVNLIIDSYLAENRK